MKKRILIVDDSKLVHDIYGAQLGEVGYKVLHAVDGISAINMIFLEMPDLILLDIHMPKINGYQICRLLKDHPVTRDIPIIIITGQVGVGIVENPQNWSFQTGANGFLQKSDEANLVEFIKPYLAIETDRKCRRGAHPTMTESEIMIALSKLLDKQLYIDTKRLEELNEKKNSFVANVSHELKSPLAAVKGHIDLVHDGFMGPLNEKQKRSLGMAQNSINRLARLIIDVLDVSKIEAGALELKEEKVNLKKIVEKALFEYEAVLSEKNITVDIKCAKDIRHVMGDSDRLIQVFVNLINNAIKYSKSGGSIDIFLENEGQSVKCMIKDAGEGVLPENLDNIFDKFARMSPGNIEGTGLGLPISKDIVTLHGGSIWAEGNESGGTTFFVTFPTLA